MSVPLSDSRLTEIRERARRMIADKVVYAPVQYAEDYSLLLAEVERLRAELAKYVSHEPTIAEEWSYLRSECQRVEAENEQLRAQVAEMRGWITEAATICRDHDTSPVKRLAESTEMFNG